MKRLALLSALVLVGCKVDPYCIGCHDAALRDAAVADSSTGDGGADGGADACVPTGPEVCNGIDDDCNGQIDDGILPMVGTVCGSDVGACKQGTYVCAGGKLLCGGGAVLPSAEDCNGIDDDCNGLIDDGDPGGGVACGSDVGECMRGMTKCDNGTITCVGGKGPTPEKCDGLDNNCDGQIDEGNPEGGASCGAGPGVCVLGAEKCLGGTLRCIGAGPPIPELCNGVDDNCNGLIDEGFDTANDPDNCGRCGNKCNLANASARCSAGQCVVDHCAPDHWDLDHDPANGCEYDCVLRGVEVCNGLDDDCDGTVDNGLLAPAICAGAGECAGTVATCSGMGGWKCHYGPTVLTNAAGDIVPETTCDGLDNDCDGVADDSFVGKGTPCTRGLGACTTTGTQVCNATHDGLTCNAPTPSPGHPEVCNGIDDDCNGIVDDGAPDDWVPFTIGGVTKYIYRYEASRPDATATDAGSLANRSCSTQNHMPWTNVTYPQAKAACTAAGGRLCSEAEWQKACESQAPTPCTWSFGGSCNTYQPAACNGVTYDFDPLRPGDQDGLLPTGSLASCYSDWGAGNHVFDLSGNVKEWAQARSLGVNPLRGGSYNNTQAGIACGFSFVVADDVFQFQNVGFRCCKD